MLSYAANAYLHPSTAYGKPVGSDSSSSTPGINNNKSIGLVTDPTKSGLIATFSGLTLGTVASKRLGNFYIRY